MFNQQPSYKLIKERKVIIMAKKRKKINSLNYQENSFIKPIYNSNNFGQFTVEEKVPTPENISPKTGQYYRVKFINTGFETVANRNSINYGKVKDKFYPNIAGVGYLGDYEGNPSNRDDYKTFDLYNAWQGMLNRCYNVNCKDYFRYGAMGVKVDPRWFNFNNFYNDAQLLFNYNKKVIYRNLYHLDKDYLQFGFPKYKKIYSPSTCIWVSYYDNNIIMNRERETSCGYYGVEYHNKYYYCIIYRKVCGKFNNPIAAANLFNYFYPLMKNIQFSDVPMQNNDVPYMSLEEIKEQAIEIIHKI